jgi:hypothetical protein
MADTNANRQAADVLRGLLDGRIKPSDARKQWPEGKVAVASSHSYIEYFEEGRREPVLDALVREQIILLEGAAVTDAAPAYDDERQVWTIGGVVALPLRPPQDVARRLLILNVVSQRAWLETLVWSEPAKRTEAESTRDDMERWVHENGLWGLLEGPEHQLLGTHVGNADRTSILRAHWMGECETSLAWALHMLDAVPSNSVPGDRPAIDRLLPRAPDEVRSFVEKARLRPPLDIASVRATLRQERQTWMQRRNPADEQTCTRSSRTLERYRAIVWLTQPDQTDLWATSANPV